MAGSPPRGHLSRVCCPLAPAARGIVNAQPHTTRRVRKSAASFDADGLRARMQKLADEIRRHDYLYYVLDRPEVSDREYDQLYAELRDLEAAHPDLAQVDSPTQRVAGVPLTAFRSVRHLAPMLSLDSVTTAVDVKAFGARVAQALPKFAGSSFVVEPKFDGLSIEVVYEHGGLVRASTRGDGEHGEDVTANVKTIRSLPLRLRTQPRKAPARLAVRGEVLMTKQAFRTLREELARKGEPPFANPRNAAAGSLRQLDARITASRPLEVVFYDVLACQGAPAFSTHAEELSALRDLGLPVSSDNRVVHSLEDALAFHDELEKRRVALPYEIDGIVVKVDDVSARARLRATARHPRWAIAYKFAPREAVSVVRHIAVQVGRTGVLTPIAVLDPVEIGGVTVKRATLHNAREIARKDLRIGDSVRVVRAGDVIPDVVERVPLSGERRASPFRMPTHCPACGARIRTQGPLESCPAGLSCPAQIVGAMVHFASRDALDIAGLGQETAQRLVERGLVKSVADLFVLRERDVVRLERFADLSAKNLVSGIERAKHTDLARFLYAIGIPEVGKVTARNLAGHFGGLDAIIAATADRLMEVEGVGPSVARSITTFFEEPNNRAVIDACRARGVVLRAARAASSGPLAGKTVVFTGTLASMPRAEAEKRVRDLGGVPSNTVGASTSFVVVGARPGSKRTRARRLGISLLTEEQFLALAGSRELHHG